MKILITSGGTKIPIDSVRHIANMSKGTFGAAICKAFLRQGHEVDFLTAENAKTPFELRLKYNEDEKLQNELYLEEQFERWQKFVHANKERYHEYTYRCFGDYVFELHKLFSKTQYDIVILAAAVSDYTVENAVSGKIRTADDMTIGLKPLPKVISTVREKQPNTFLVGFKLLVNSLDHELIEAAKQSIVSNKCDMVVANDLRDIKQDNHRLLLVEPSKEPVSEVQVFEKKTCKMPLAEKLVERILFSKESKA